jgi:2-oxoglutarate dehydrogenase E2 component (dihydrolipoamide succinyltransferase)
MAAIEIKVTPAGESITHATLLRWLKPDGATVRTGEPICELETDKATKEEYAPSNGVLAIQVQPGTRVAIGAIIGSVDPAGVPKATPVPTEEVRLSPAARVLVDTQGIDASKITPSARGVVTKSDVLGHLGSADAPPRIPPPEEKPAQPPAPPLATALPSNGRETRQRMSPVRARIAERLLAAQQSAAILTTFNEADLSRIQDLRARYKEPFQQKHGVGLGFMGFFVKACVEALQTYPAVNARIDGPDIVYHHYYHLGVAVSTERGLIVPVLRDCDRLSFAEIEKGIASLAQKARENKISVSDLQGGTFTITNGGVFGSLLSTPILNPPQSGILGMHAIQKRPVVVDDQVVIRPMMYLALSYDHRIIDGREAVRFLVRVKECIENPERLFLSV